MIFRDGVGVLDLGGGGFDNRGIVAGGRQVCVEALQGIGDRRCMLCPCGFRKRLHLLHLLGVLRCFQLRPSRFAASRERLDVFGGLEQVPVEGVGVGVSAAQPHLSPSALELGKFLLGPG